jgi:hypothetical protein
MGKQDNQKQRTKQRADTSKKTTQEQMNTHEHKEVYQRKAGGGERAERHAAKTVSFQLSG